MRREFAQASQTIQLNDQTANSVYTMDEIRLSSFDRMVNIARNYQFFRMTKVTVKFKPFADTFIPGTGGTVLGQSVPYFYHLVNKGNVLNTASFNALRDAGAKPRRFDDKTVSVSWKPAVLVGTQDWTQGVPSTNTYNPATKRISPWLATNNSAGYRTASWIASSIDHCGILYGVEQDQTGSTGQLSYGIEICCDFEFKGPLNAPGLGDEHEPVRVDIVPKEQPEIPA